MTSNRVAATMRLELGRWVRDPIIWAGLALFLALVALGMLQHRNALPPRSTPDRGFGYAYGLFALLAMHTGIARDRSDRFDSLLTANFLSTREMFVTRIGSLLAILMVTAIATLILGLIISFGDVKFAAWYAILLTTLVLVFFPALVLIELMLNTRYPIAIILLLFMVAATILRYFGQADVLVKIIPLDFSPYDYAALGQLMLRIIPGAVLTFLLYPLYRKRIGAPRRRALPM